MLDGLTLSHSSPSRRFLKKTSRFCAELLIIRVPIAIGQPLGIFSQTADHQARAKWNQPGESASFAPGSCVALPGGGDVRLLSLSKDVSAGLSR
jgi:hypothetical protein